MSRVWVFRIVAGALVAFGIVHVGSLVPRVTRLAADLPSAATWIAGGYVLSAVTALLACMLAAVLLWKAADRPAGRLLTLFLAFLAIFWGSLFRFVQLERDADSLSVGLTYDSGWVSQTALAAFMLATTTFVRFSALFPRPLTPDRLPPARWRHARKLREATLRPGPVWGAAIVLFLLIRFIPALIGWFAGPGPPEGATVLLLIRANLILVAAGYLIVPFIAGAIGVLNLRTSHRLASHDERRRMTWLIVGFSLAAWLIVAALGIGIVVGTLGIPDRLAVAIPVLFGLAPLLVVTGSAIGILYGGAIDPGLALQRSTVWGLLTAFAVVAFAGLENALSAFVESRLGLPGSAGSMAAGAIVAVALLPLRAPVRRRVASLLTGHQDRSRATINASASGPIDPEASRPPAVE